MAQQHLNAARDDSQGMPAKKAHRHVLPRAAAAQCGTEGAWHPLQQAKPAKHVLVRGNAQALLLFTSNKRSACAQQFLRM